jgi:anti-anti-sigma regulatory factor
MVAVFDHTVCIKVSGRANFTSSLDLKKLIQELCDRGFTRFIFDLSDCLMMDSTFLGLLSGIGLKFSDSEEAIPTHSLELLNPNPRITETLENLGVSHLFQICQGTEPAANNFAPLAHDEASRTEITRTCLEAHQTLMGINPENVRKFKDVAQFLADDLKKLELAEKK